MVIGFTLHGRKPVNLESGRRTGVILALVCATNAWASDDAYLDALNEEVTKVDFAATDNGDGPLRVPGDPLPGAAEGGRSPGEFEAFLEREHIGTYSFYRKLTPRSRDEIYQEYANGAPMDVIREKIVDRYLHP